jgi:purine-binding chemotaxis protein CheW
VSGVHVRVRVGGEHYALPVAGVLEVAPMGEISRVPGAPRPVLGVRNLRGQVLPVVDLGAALGIEAAGSRSRSRILVTESGFRRAGLAVDSVLGVAELPEATTAADSGCLAGAVLVDGDLVGVVDVDATLRVAGGESGP